MVLPSMRAIRCSIRKAVVLILPIRASEVLLTINLILGTTLPPMLLFRDIDLSAMASSMFHLGKEESMAPIARKLSTPHLVAGKFHGICLLRVELDLHRSMTAVTAIRFSQVT